MNPRKDLSPELAAVQKQLGAVRGKRYWRSLEELADTPAFQELMQREFAQQASEWPSALSRRQFLTLMGASLALAGLSGCSVRPAARREIVPYVHPPEEVVPGKPLFYATAMTLGGLATGLLVESHEGRPTKVEGNPNHPASQGATDALAQASILTLYDPDRAQTVKFLGRPRTFEDVIAALRTRLGLDGSASGSGKGDPTRPTSCSQGSTAGLRRASTPLICRKRERFSASSS